MPTASGFTPRTFKPQELQAALRSGSLNAPASTLRTEVQGDGTANCLERAVAVSRPGDQVVLLSDSQDASGHAVVQQSSGQVVDPNTPNSPYASMEAFQQQNPRYGNPVAVSGEQAQQVLSTPVGPQRDALIRSLGLDGAADRSVADDGVTTSLDHLHAAQASNDPAAMERARGELRTSIDQSGIPLDQVNARYASASPADRVAIAEATSDVGRERGDRLAQQYGVTPSQEGKPGTPGEHEITEARRLEGVLRDQLSGTADQAVTTLRQGGASREDALVTLRQTAGPTAGSVLNDRPGVPNTVGMTDEEKQAVYEPYRAQMSPEAQAAYDRGERVVIAFRCDSPLDENNHRGEFDDRFVVMQKDHPVREFDASLDPNATYDDNRLNGGGADFRDTFNADASGVTGPYAQGNPGVFSDDVQAYGRLSGGQTVLYQAGPNAGHLYPPASNPVEEALGISAYNIDGDINGDGRFNDNHTVGVYENGYQLHGSAVGHTGSAGCITVPFHRWDEFRGSIVNGDDQHVYVTVI